MGITWEGDPNRGYVALAISGVLHYGPWQRDRAAATILGDERRAQEVPLGLEVDDVEQAVASGLNSATQFVQGKHNETWGQITARFYLPEQKYW